MKTDGAEAVSLQYGEKLSHVVVVLVVVAVVVVVFVVVFLEVDEAVGGFVIAGKSSLY